MLINKTAILVGGTGLVGSQLLKLLIEDKTFSRLIILTRRSTGVVNDKIEEHIVDFNDISSFSNKIVGDVLFSCMGTTLKQAGSKSAQFLVDFTYQYEVAQAAAKNNVPDYVLISSAGANPESRMFYSRMKGDLDEEVEKLPFIRIKILRPSVLVGDREHKRVMEEIGAKFITGVGQIIPAMSKYRAIKDIEVARAMINAYKIEANDYYKIYELDEVFELLNE